MKRYESGNHNCKEHLDDRCKCMICGKVLHDFKDDDDGSFAASGRITTAWCTRCWKTERYYADTGTIVETDFGSEDGC